LKLSSEERTSGVLNEQTLRSAVEQVKVNGYVLFEGTLPSDLVDELHTTFLRTLDAYIARSQSNRGTNRYQMHLPFAAPFNDPRVISNPVALQVIDAVLGDDCHVHYFASDTPLPGSDYQRVHSDLAPLFPNSDLALPAFSLVLNIPLVDFRLDNGPLEIWPGGTHLMPGAVSEQLAEVMHSEPVLMPAGSLLIRDIRMWHRGTPNRTDAPRPNLALIYSRAWFREAKYPPIAISQESYDQLSERGKQLFRFENISGTRAKAREPQLA
jgi:hypothetical protein